VVRRETSPPNAGAFDRRRLGAAVLAASFGVWISENASFQQFGVGVLVALVSLATLPGAVGIWRRFAGWRLVRNVDERGGA